MVAVAAGGLSAGAGEAARNMEDGEAVPVAKIWQQVADCVVGLKRAVVQGCGLGDEVGMRQHAVHLGV